MALFKLTSFYLSQQSVTYSSIYLLNAFWSVFYILLVPLLITELKKIFNTYSLCISISNHFTFLEILLQQAPLVTPFL